MIVIAPKLRLMVKRLGAAGECHCVDGGAFTLSVSVIRMVGMLEPTRLPMTSEGRMDSGKFVMSDGETDEAAVGCVSPMSYAHPALASHIQLVVLVWDGFDGLEVMV